MNVLAGHARPKHLRLTRESLQALRLAVKCFPGNVFSEGEKVLRAVNIYHDGSGDDTLFYVILWRLQ